MSLGRCAYLTCDSMLGVDFKAVFWRLENGAIQKTILLCKSHRELCEYMRAEKGQLNITDEGWAYTTPWMATLT